MAGEGNQVGVIVVGKYINENAWVELIKKENAKYVIGTPFNDEKGQKCIPINKGS